MGASKVASALWLANHNLTLDATITIEGSDNDADWTTIVNAQKVFTSWWGWGEGEWGLHGWGGLPTLADFPSRSETFRVAFTSQAWQYWRVSITDATNPDGYFEIGRAFLGTEYQTTYQWGSDYGVVDPSPTGFTDGGQHFASAQQKRLNISVPIDFKLAAEFRQTIYLILQKK